MAKDERNIVEETLIEAPLSEQELETLLEGFLQALEKEYTYGILNQKREIA